MRYCVLVGIAAVAVGLLGSVKHFQAQSPVVVMEVPEGELVWTKERPKGAKMCIPAAFTDPEGEVEGEYRLDGKVYHPNKRLKVSIGKGTFYIDRKWHSDTGFQQLSLVYNDKPRTFKDRRKSIRRALCKNGDRVFLIQSRTRMTLTDFAAACAPLASNAVYLDMGEYGYGYIGQRVLSPWAYFRRKKQSNWICVR